MKKGYVDIPEGQIHYRTEGSGEPLLLLHGTLLSSAEFDSIIPILSTDYRVIAMDLLGQGNSDSPPRPDYTIEEHGRVVSNVLNHMEIEKTSMVGVAGGATLGVELAAVYPERVDKLILCGLLVKTVEETQAGRLKGRRSGGSYELEADGKFIMNVWALWKRMLESHVTTQELFGNFIIAMDRYKRYHNFRDWMASEHTWWQYKVGDKIDRVQAPTMLICDEKRGTVEEKEGTINEVDYIEKRVPDWSVKIIENIGLGFYPCTTNPQAFAQAILEFLETPGV